jgi:hypothetical protein
MAWERSPWRRWRKPMPRYALLRKKGFSTV